MLNSPTDWSIYKGMIDFKRLTILTILSIICMWSSVLYANPTGQSVQSGSATFNQQGNTLNVTNSPGTIINWQDFSIKENETTRFIQQSVDSSVLNRVIGQDPSKILGRLQSNGRVFVINPNGISFGANSIVDVGGLVASTLNLSNEDFLSQNLNFTGDGTNGVINNQGAITSSEGGFIYLVATDIENHGVITSDQGDVILAAGHSVQLVNSDNPDIRVTLTAPEGEVLNVGEIITQGGKTSIYAGLINQQGVVKADSAVVGENGKVFFKSTTRTKLTSTSVTSANGVDGGSVTIQTTEGLTEVSGQVSATGSNGKGGDVLILGDEVSILNGSITNASGTNGGGTALVGGSWQNNNTLIQQSNFTIVESGAIIKANAIEDGDGGTIVAWSDITNHDSATFAHGKFEVMGGNNSGNGGRIETSGGYLNVADININATAHNGIGGEWLLDPFSITIDAAGPTTTGATSLPSYQSALTSVILNSEIEAQLDAGTNVTIQTGGTDGDAQGDGDITVNAAISKTAGGAATLTLNAHDDVFINNTISSTSNALNVVLNADHDASGVGSVFITQAITTNGSTFDNGAVTITGMDLSIGATIDTGGAYIYVAPSVTGTPTSIGGSETFNLIQTDIDNLSTVGLIYYGYNKNISSTTASTVDLTSVSAITSGAYLRVYANGNTTVGANNLTVIGNPIEIYTNYSGGADVFTSGSGQISGTSSSIGYYSDIIIGSGGINVTGNLSLRSDDLDVNGSITASTVSLIPHTQGNSMSIEGSSAYNLTQTDLTYINTSNAIHIGSINLATFDIASTGAADIGAENIYIQSGGSITVGPNSFSAVGGSITLDNHITGADITTGAANISSSNVTMTSMDLITIGSGGVTASAGNTYLSGADLSLGGTITADNLYLYPKNTNTAISVGGSETFNLVQGDFSSISANTLYVGYDGSSTYASTFDLTSASAIDVGGTIFNAYATGNVTVGANNLTATGGYLQFYSTGTSSFTSSTGGISGTTFYSDAFNDMTIGSGGITTTDVITLNGTNGVTQNGDLTSSSTGTITVNSTNGFITMNSTALTSTNGRNITYSANGNIGLARLNTGATSGDVSVTSSTGSITDVGAATNNIIASSTVLNASTGIGNAGFEVYFNDLGTTNLTANTNSGGVTIDSNTAMNLGSIYGGATGAVTLNTFGGTSYMSSGVSIISGAGVYLNSSQNMTIGAGGVNSDGALSLTAAGVFSQSGNLSTTAAGNLIVKANTANLNAISTSAGVIGIEANQVSLAGYINSNSGTGDVYIMPSTNNAISIDGSETFDLTQGELNNINFGGKLTIGSDGTTTRATTASISSIASTTVGGGGGGGGTGIIHAINDITFGANGFTASGENVSFISDSGSLNFGAGILTAGTITLTAANNIVDNNGIGVNNIVGTNLNVNSGGNASLDYDITGTLTSTGVVGVADLRPFSSTTTTTTTTVAASTNEPLPTTLDTISTTTNNLQPPPPSGSTISTAPLGDAPPPPPDGTDPTTDDTQQAGDPNVPPPEKSADSETEEESTTAEEDAQVASSEEEKKTQQLAAAKLPLCK